MEEATVDDDFAGGDAEKPWLRCATTKASNNKRTRIMVLIRLLVEMKE